MTDFTRELEARMIAGDTEEAVAWIVVTTDPTITDSPNATCMGP